MHEDMVNLRVMAVFNSVPQREHSAVDLNRSHMRDGRICHMWREHDCDCIADFYRVTRPSQLAQDRGSPARNHRPVFLAIGLVDIYIHNDMRETKLKFSRDSCDRADCTVLPIDRAAVVSGCALRYGN